MRMSSKQIIAAQQLMERNSTVRPSMGDSFSFPVNGVIKGWSEALKMMPVGSKWELYVPADLAYGDEGSGEDIAPGSTLVFDVELLSIKKNAATAPPGPDQQPESEPQKKPAGSK